MEHCWLQLRVLSGCGRNLPDKSSVEETESGDEGDGSSITGGEVTEAIKQLLGGWAPGVDEVRVEFLKALDNVGLSWLADFCNVMWSSGRYLWIGRQGLMIPSLRMWT